MSDIDPNELERSLDRYLVEHRMTRRDLLERVARLGAVAALAPIAAACSAAASASPSAVASSGAPSSVAPSSAAPASSAAASSTAPSASPSPSPSSTPVPSPEAELFVYNWDAYIGEKTVADFEKKFNIKVTYDKFPDEATQLAKIRSDGKGGGYDLTIPTSVEIPGLAADGVIQALDLSLIPNAKNLGPAWSNPGYDPGNKYSMPYMWWTTGFAWDPDKIKDDLTSWTALWDERFKGHIGMLDDVREVFAAAAFRLGLSPNTTSDGDLDQMLNLLQQQKPLLRKYTADDIADLSSGSLWISQAWSGDYLQTLVDKPKMKYVVPIEGAIRGSDTMVVLSGAKHPIAANLFINYNLDAQISANNSNYIGYMGPNQAAQQFIDPTILENPSVNPDKAVLDKLTELLQLGPNLDKYTQRWNLLKA